MSNHKHIMLIAGEASGDSHASHLVAELKAMDPELIFSGLGGPKMQEAGVALDEDLTRFAVVGFVEVLKHYGEFQRCLKQFIKNVKLRQPAAVILIDYPGFNLIAAKKLKQLKGFRGKVIYYISPQLWAWKEDRIKTIKKYVDRMLVIFEFEKEFYWRHGIEVDFVGHPLIDAVSVTADREKTLLKSGLSADKITLGILPGSRQREIESLLPNMLSAAEILYKKFPQFQFLILKAPSVEQTLFDQILKNQNLPIKILENDYYNGLNSCDLCMVASGTATLETALLQKPMVVIYKTSFLTYLLAKLLIKIPYIGLVNVVAGKKIVPECIQANAAGPQIAQELSQMYSDAKRRSQIISELSAIRSKLGSTGTSRRAAEGVLRQLQ